MKKLVLKAVVTVMMLNAAGLMAQYTPPTWGWAISGSNTGFYSFAEGVKCDNAGNIYTHGRYAGTFNYGGLSVSGGGATPIFNAKLNAATGAGIWLKKAFATGGYDYPYGCCLDKSGNFYCTGTSNSASSGIYFQGNSSAGVSTMAKTLPPSGSGRGVCADGAGNIFTTGCFSTPFNFGTGVITPAGSDMYLVKYNSTGTIQWAVKGGGPGGDMSCGCVCDAAGNVYVVGGYNGTCSFGTINLPASGAYSNMFIVKYSPTGTPIWATYGTNAGILNGSWWEDNEIAIDACGYLFVAGHYHGNASFGAISLTNSGLDDGFVAKFDSNNGACQWAQSMGGPAQDQAVSVAVDDDGDAYVTGYYSGPIVFSNTGGFSLGTTSPVNSFVAKYCGGNGALVWAQRITGTGSAGVSAGGIAVDNFKNSYVIGSYGAGSAVMGSSTLPATSGPVGFVFTTRINAGNNYTIAPTLPTVLCSGACTTIPYTAVGPFLGTNTFSAQLSDANGSFTSTPITIGTLNSASSGVINICIPASVAPGTKYKIRIVSSAPSYCSKFDCINTITISTGPAVTLSNSGPVCVGKPLSFTGSNAVTYSWSGPNGFTSTLQNPSITVTTSNNNGTYTLTVTSANGCKNSDSTKVVINPLPTIKMNAPVACLNQPINLTALGGLNFTWSGPLSFTSSSQNPVIPNATLGMVGNYTVTVADANGCVSSSVTAVAVNPLPTPFAGNNSPVCAQQTLNLNAAGGTSYSWAGPNGFTSTLQNPTLVNATTNNSGSYTVTVIDNNKCFATATVAAIVNALPQPQIMSSNNKGCAPLCMTFTATNNGTIKSCDWKFDDGGSDNNINTSRCFNIAGQYTVAATVTDNNGCVSSTTYSLESYPVPVADFNYAPIKPLVNTEVNFTDASHGADIKKYDWYFTNQPKPHSNLQNPTYIYTEAGTYGVAMVITSNHGCMDTIVKNIIVGEDFEVFVPNAFTPNGDGLNDVFQPKGYGFSKYELQVFDRWGEKVFASNDVTQGWAGNYQKRGDNVVEEGTYVWRITLTTVFGKSSELTGNVTVMK